MALLTLDDTMYHVSYCVHELGIENDVNNYCFGNVYWNVNAR